MPIDLTPMLIPFFVQLLSIIVGISLIIIIIMYELHLISESEMSDLILLIIIIAIIIELMWKYGL